MSVEERIRAHIVNTLRYTDPLPLDRSLREAMVLDSGNVLGLVAFLEKEFGIVIHDEELVPANFDTLACVVELVRRKTA